MSKNFFKALLTSVLLVSASTAYAIPWGAWKLVSYDSGTGVTTTKKAFDLCIQQDGGWYISSIDRGWKGKWFEHADGEPSGYSNEIILQAVHSQTSRMRSLVLPFEGDIATEPGLYTELSTSGKTHEMRAMMVYKGSKCAPYLDVDTSAKQATPASARPVDCLLEVKGKTYIKGVCGFLSMGGGDFLLKSAETEYTAYLNILGKDKGRVSWNGEDGSRAPGVSLGGVERKGACWRNEVVKLCARGLTAASLAKVKGAKDAKIKAAKDEKNKESRQRLALQSAVKTMGHRSLKNEFTGPSQCLTLLSGGEVAMSRCITKGNTPVPEQTWYMTAYENGDDFYMMKNSHASSEQCLEYNPESEKMFMRACGDYPSPRGLWTAEQQGTNPSYFRFRLPIGAGQNKCLDIINDGINNRVHMATCGNYSGQVWK